MGISRIVSVPAMQADARYITMAEIIGRRNGEISVDRYRVERNQYWRQRIAEETIEQPTIWVAKSDAAGFAGFIVTSPEVDWLINPPFTHTNAEELLLRAAGVERPQPMGVPVLRLLATS